MGRSEGGVGLIKADLASAHIWNMQMLTSGTSLRLRGGLQVREAALSPGGGRRAVPSEVQVPLPPSACQRASGGVSSGQLTPAEIMLIAFIFSFLLERNQQIIYFSSFITDPL